MSASLPPSPSRLAAARRAGLWPRSRLGVTALCAASLAFAGYALGSRIPAALSRALTRAFAGEGLALPSTASAGLGLVILITLLAGCLTLTRGGVRSVAEPGLSQGLDEIPAVLRWALGGAALLLAWFAMRASLAGAARAVDAPLAPETLVRAWAGWTLRGFVALAGVAATVGVIERLASARRLWQGLHLTPAQARERARASGQRRT